LSQLLRLPNRLTGTQRKFFAEIIGTFIVVVFATGSVVIDARLGGILDVYLFGRISLAHFNPAVTVGYLITGHLRRELFLYYIGAEIIGALLGSLFVKYIIGTESNLGANAPNYNFPLPIIFGVEVIASALLMAVILVVVHTKGLRGFSGIAIGGIVGLDIYYLSFISGASMNPARSLAPAILSGSVGDLWLYWSATFIGTSIIALIFRQKITCCN
jgi:aquaporin Z